MEKVSVIIPCYNGAGFIDRSINSVYQQSYPSIELIVVDDGSTDNSKKKILKWKPLFEEKGFILKYVYQENGGPASAINTGLKYVTGEYLSLLDADDEYLSNIFEERVSCMQKHPDVDVVRSNGWIVKGENKRLFVTNEKEKQIEDVFLALLIGETNNWAGSYMVRTKALFDFYPDREIYTSRFGQNLQLLLPLTYKKKCIFIDEPHMNYIQQDNSLSQATDNKYEREETNSQGYMDIYTHVIRQVVSDKEERRKYMCIIEASFCRSAMLRAITYNSKTNAIRCFKNLKEGKQCGLNDYIVFYEYSCPMMGLILKCIRKMIFYLSALRGK